MWTLLLILSCAKEIPPHLRVEPVQVETHTQASLHALIASDPLVRRPDARQPGDWTTLSEGQAIETWAAVARASSVAPSDWLQVEAQTRGTVGVALARGAMLAGLEVTRGAWTEQLQQSIAGWLGLKRVAARPIGSRPGAPLDWLVGLTPERKLENARHLAERRVLLGWVDGPAINLKPVSKALQSSSYTGLATTPIGMLIYDRAQDMRSPEDRVSGTSKMWEASEHALRWAGADTNKDQTRLRIERDTHRDTYGETASARALREARVLLTADAAEDDSAGLALVVIAAERIEGSCPDKPCEGLDRVAALKRAEVWGPTARQAAAVWMVIAAKQALDTLEASLDRPSLHRRLPEIAEVLSAASGQSIELSFLRHRVKSPALLLSISRMAGGEPQTDPLLVLDTVREQLILLCDEALDLSPPDQVQAAIMHIKARAARRLQR